MHEWISSVLGASLIPGIALALSAIAQRLLRSPTKDIVTKDETGKTETLTIPANAGAQEIREKIDEAYSFEAEIADALSELQRKRNLHAHAGLGVDFVVEIPQWKLGLEVKLAVDRVSPAMVERYLRAEENLKHLLLVSRAAPSNQLTGAINSWMWDNRVSVITIPEGVSAAPILEQALSKLTQ